MNLKTKKGNPENKKILTITPGDNVQGQAFAIAVGTLFGSYTSCSGVPGFQCGSIRDSSFLPTSTLGSSRWWLKQLVPGGRQEWSCASRLPSGPEKARVGIWGMEQ